MSVTPQDLRNMYPWMANLPPITDPGYADALTASDTVLQTLIDMYSMQLDPDIWGDCLDMGIMTLIANQRSLDDRNCIEIATAMKQLESGKNLSLDNIFQKGCGCDNDAWLSLTKYGLQFKHLRDNVLGGAFTMTVIGC